MTLSSANRKSGFTLLEMLIAIVILAFISLGIVQALWETFRLRDVLSEEGDFYNSIRMSTDILRRDINAIYSPKLMMPPRPSPSPGAPDSAAGAGVVDDMAELSTSQKFWGPALDKSGIRPSRFVGTESSLSFVSVSHIRIYKDAPESDFSKVTYELLRESSGDEGATLLKTENPNAFAEDTVGRPDKRIVTYPLLRGVSKMSLRYYQKSTGNWVTGWDTDREEFRNIYPDIIEMTLEVKGRHRLSFEGVYQFRPEVPVNGYDPSS